MIETPVAAALVHAVNEVNLTLLTVRKALAHTRPGAARVALIGATDALADLERVAQGLDHEEGGGALYLAARGVADDMRDLAKHLDRQEAAGASDLTALAAAVESIDFDGLLAQADAMTRGNDATPARRLW